MKLCALSQLEGDTVNRFVGVLFKLQTAPPLEKLHQLEANLLVLFGGALSVGVKLRQQMRKRLFSKIPIPLNCDSPEPLSPIKRSHSFRIVRQNN